jgi:hypothetical protein
MLKTKSLTATVGAIAILASLIGCTPEPASKPTASPSAAAKTPDAKSVATKNDAATKSDARILKVKIDGLETYKHPSGLFQIDAPKGWTPTVNKKANEVIVLWFDPTKNALITVDVFKAPSETTPEQLTALLEKFLKQTFGSRPGFATEKPVPQKDGSVQVVWSYDESIKTITAKVQGNSFISRSGDKISLITTGGVADQIPALKESFDKVVNSYKVNPEIVIPATP